MPTAYTSVLHDGEVSFTEFVWRCSRAFGPQVMMRDLPLEASVPLEDVPPPHYAEAVTKATLELSRVRELTQKQAAAEMQQELAEGEQYYAREVTRIKAMRGRYEAMLQQVEQWEPPDSHKGLKDFMRDQLRDSIKYDCGVPDKSWYVQELPFAEWLANKVSRAEKEVGARRMALEDAVRACHMRTEWRKQLAASVGTLEGQ